MKELKEIKAWLSHHSKSSARKNESYLVLFEGPGTNKITTAQMLGKEFGKEVYHIKLSQVASKYIGETEKNIAAVFKKAEGKKYILFFDEADALFGKRTNVKDSHDRYANQEISYLLQQVENYPGLVVLATNAKKNIDEAFLRRLRTIVHFPEV